MQLMDVLTNYLTASGFGQLQWPNLVMIALGLLFIFLAIRKGFEPLLLVPIGFGMLIGNIPYNSAVLPLGVYDGPAPRASLQYFVAGKPLKVAFVDPQGRPAVRTLDPWTPVPRRFAYHAPAWANAGQAILVNHHNLFSVEHMPAGFVPPGLVDLGQGRQVFVPRIEKNHQYAQLWSQAKQDPANASVFYWLYAGVGFGFFPPLIFLGIGALTDFGPLLSNPKTLLLGAAAQFGIFGSLLGATYLHFDLKQSASIGIIGGADGPTAIFTSSQLAPELLGAVALAAYSYMAMVPIIQPPIMKLLTTHKERRIRMKQLRPVSKRVRILFPLLGFLLTVFLAPGALPLLGMLFFGNLLRESLVTDRLAKTAQTAFIDIVTILLGLTVGAKTNAASFLTVQTLFIFVLGILAFGVATAAGVLFAKLINLFSHEKINPLIGAAGVSAVPMAARVAHKLGQDEDPQNFLLMHAMGPNVAGVIGSAVAAGVLLSRLAGH